jgi:dTMP kinase
VCKGECSSKMSVHSRVDSHSLASVLQGLDFEWCRSPDIGLPSPDLTLFLHLTPEVAAKRGGYGEERYESVSMQSKVRECFTTIGQEMQGKNWQIIDASRGVEEVAQDCSKAAFEVLKIIREHNAPIGKLFQK